MGEEICMIYSPPPLNYGLIVCEFEWQANIQASSISTRIPDAKVLRDLFVFAKCIWCEKNVKVFTNSLVQMMYDHVNVVICFLHN